MIATVGGSSGGVFSWSAIYDDSTNPDTLTVQADGQGRDTAVIAQLDGQQAAIYFVQPSGPLAIPLSAPPGVTIAASRTVVIGSGPVAFNTPALQPFPPSKPGGVYSFRLTNEQWSST